MKGVRSASKRSLALQRSRVQPLPKSFRDLKLFAKGQLLPSVQPGPHTVFSFRNRFRRPEKVPWTERRAEGRLAKAYDWDLDMLRGMSSLPEASRGDKHRILNPNKVLFRRRPSIDVVRLSYWLHFGNAVQQLKNAFQVAEKLGARTLQFLQPHPFFEGERSGHFELIWGNAPCTSPALEGEFFNAKTFRLGATAFADARVYAELLRPMLNETLRTPDPRIAGDDLVLHFRAGDIFRQSKPPNPRYGQPPLSFYLEVVDREQPSRVWLVFQDRSNPCIDAAEAAIRQRGIQVNVQSGALADDLRLMLSAPRLVLGRGSFGHMVAHLSGRLEKAYFFERSCMEQLRHLGVEVVVARDVDGEFKSKLLKNNWSASAEQRSLMLSYPTGKLSFEDKSHVAQRRLKWSARSLAPRAEGATSRKQYLPPVVHVTFGTSDYSQSLSRLRRSANRVGIHTVRIYRPHSIAVRRAAMENPELIKRRRGAGYWLWKPYILLDAMDAAKEGTIIIYTDAGQRYLADPSPLISLAAERDVLLFHNNAGYLQRTWTKRDCFVLMEADTPEHWNALQLDASIQIYRAGPRARSFLAEWQAAMRDPRILSDAPNTCGLPNFGGFREHRHDQSILTILAMKHGVECFPSPKILPKHRLKILTAGSHKPLTVSRGRLIVFEHHRCTNESLKDYSHRLLKEHFGMT
jgi:hypothetical protein